MTGFDYQTVTHPIFEFSTQEYTKLLEKLGPDCRGAVILYESYPYQKFLETPPDGTAYGNRGKHFNCTVFVRWETPELDESVKAWIKDFIKEAREIDRREMRKEGLNETVEGAYVNFHLPDDRVEMAFGTNLPRLVKLKRKWDPKGIFNKWFNIPT